MVAMVPKVVKAQVAKIGVVDVERLVDETDEGRRAKARLKAIFEQKQKDLDLKQTEFQEMTKQFEKQKLVMKPDAREARQKEMRDKWVELQGVLVKHQQDFAAKEADFVRDLLQKASRIIQKIAETNGLTLVLQKRPDVVLYAQPQLDVTADLIRRFNAGEGGKLGAAAATGGKGSPASRR
jgi:outer membrane protein